MQAGKALPGTHRPSLGGPSYAISPCKREHSASHQPATSSDKRWTLGSKHHCPATVLLAVVTLWDFHFVTRKHRHEATYRELQEVYIGPANRHTRLPFLHSNPTTGHPEGGLGTCLVGSQERAWDSGLQLEATSRIWKYFQTPPALSRGLLQAADP